MMKNSECFPFTQIIWALTWNHWSAIPKAIDDLFMNGESKWKSPSQLFSIRWQSPVDKYDRKKLSTWHSWLEMSKTSHGDESSDRFTLPVSTATLRAVLMVSTFSHQRGVVVKSVYDGPTLRPSSESFMAIGRDEPSPGNQQQLLSLPHFSAGYPVTGWRSGVDNSQSLIT